MAYMQIKGITKRYGTYEAVRGIDIDIAEREFVVIVGPSGCGKSTLLRMIAGLESISRGELVIDGQRMNDVRPADRGIAMVFQSYALYPHKTVEQNMGFALKVAKTPKDEAARKIARAAEILQLGPLLKRLPKEL
ncbi:ABC transporter ATP-binding protein, partial [Tabrizicola sp.]|uniref:ABC transporter ATP-binding protein n=1 Tax=Tabrizicola sp. TaxID=2005166 RepID=UPI001A60B8D9